VDQLRWETGRESETNRPTSSDPRGASTISCTLAPSLRIAASVRING
jgi:hypothetical protein